MNIFKKLKQRLFNKEFEIINTRRNKQSIVLRDEKVINPIALNDQKVSLNNENGITHKVVLAINEKLAVYGVGEVSSYDFNKKGELVMDLALYENKVRINQVPENL